MNVDPINLNYQSESKSWEIDAVGISWRTHIIEKTGEGPPWQDQSDVVREKVDACEGHALQWTCITDWSSNVQEISKEEAKEALLRIAAVSEGGREFPGLLGGLSKMADMAGDAASLAVDGLKERTNAITEVANQIASDFGLVDDGLVDIDSQLAKQDEELAETSANIAMAEERLKFVIKQQEEEERKNRGIRGFFRKLSGKG